MAEGRTYLLGSGGDDAERVPLECQFGVGRGFLNQPSETRTPGPGVTALGTPQLTSTRYVDRAMPSHFNQNPDLGSLITQLAEKLGESITAHLQAGRGTNSMSAPLPTETTLPNVSVVLQSAAKEPPLFRGDGSDKCTVHEWENLMTLYLKRRAIPVHEQSQEILAKLMGKAGDVVRVKLRNTSTNHATNPHVIFDTLKQHFSELSYSSMPLSDFYNTLPAPGEDAMEYWVRLNKTVDVADECLKRQGRSIDDPGHEVSMMFIKHCPDQSLHSVFKFKSADKWSACEIQDRLDEHMQDKKSRSAAARPLRPSVVEHRAHSCHVPMLEEAPLLNTAAPPSQPSAPSTTAGVDNDCMKGLVNLLDRLVTMHTQVPANPGTQAAMPRSFQRVCKVCGAPNHSTLSHCKQDNLCLQCLCPGHWKRDCPQRTNQHRFQHNGRAGDHNQRPNQQPDQRRSQPDDSAGGQPQQLNY